MVKSGKPVTKGDDWGYGMRYRKAKKAKKAVKKTAKKTRKVAKKKK